MWKVVPRVFLDDVEAKYRPRYDRYKQNLTDAEAKHKEYHSTSKCRNKLPYTPLYTKPANYPDGRDPKALRIRQKSDLWNYLTTELADEEELQEVLKEMDKQFRSIQTVPIPQGIPLTDEQKEEFEKFRRKACRAIGYTSETSSFLVHGNQALDLFEGELKELNVFGPKVDPYLVPVMNALVPMIKKGVEPAIFINES